MNNNENTLIPIRGFILFFSAEIMMSFADITAKVLTGYFPVSQITSFRWGIQMLGVAIILMITEGPRGFIVEKSWLKTYIIQGSMLLISTLLLYIGFQKLDVSIATTLFLLYPIFTIVVGKLFYKDKVKPLTYILSCVSFLGAVLIALSKPAETNNHVSQWIFVPIVGAIIFAIFTNYSKRIGKHGKPVLGMFYMSLIPTVLVLSYSIFVHNWRTSDNIIPYILLVVNACFIGVGYMLLMMSYRYLTPARLAPFYYFELVLTIILSRFLLQEILPWKGYIGILLILISGTIISISMVNRKKKKKNQDPVVKTTPLN